MELLERCRECLVFKLEAFHRHDVQLGGLELPDRGLHVSGPVFASTGQPRPWPMNHVLHLVSSYPPGCEDSVRSGWLPEWIPYGSAPKGPEEGRLLGLTMAGWAMNGFGRRR